MAYPPPFSQVNLGAAWAAVVACISSLSMDAAFRILVMLGCVPMYVREMRKLKNTLSLIAPRQHLSSFLKFVVEYTAASDIWVVVCGCVLIAATIQWVAESQQAYPLCEWSFSQAFLAISVTYAVACLGLTTLYIRGLRLAAMSQKRVNKWTERASQSLTNKYINISVALATPEAWAKGSVIFMVASQIALRLQTSYVPEPGEGTASSLLRLITLAVVGLIALHSFFMAYVFLHIANFRGGEEGTIEFQDDSTPSQPARSRSI